MTQANDKLQSLQNDWNAFKKTPLTNTVAQEWLFFLDWKRQFDIAQLALEDYTALRSGDSTAYPYFTNLMERKTEHCGKFRTASSYAYGVYRVRKEKGSEQAAEVYRSVDVRGSGKDLKPAEAHKYFTENVRPVLRDLKDFADRADLRPLEINFARKVAYMYNPGQLLALYKNEVIRTIASYIGLTSDHPEEAKQINEQLDSYKATAAIKSKLDAAWEITSADADWDEATLQKWGVTEGDIPLTQQFELSQKLSNFLYQRFGASFSFEHKNIIYYGAPGTGKTYTVEQAIRQLAVLEGRKVEDMREFVQFHPSYSYEDFIEGLKPVNTPNGIGLALQSGMFKRFCRKAMLELKAAHEERRPPQNFYFVADEINRAELSRVLGEVLVCLEESKRLRYKKDGELDGLLLKTQYSHLCAPADAVHTIGEAHYFGIPANLYFIGTMNDIDRSIDSFDMALRRRFVWHHLGCDYDVIREYFAGDKNLDRYVALCEGINEFIRDDLGLGYAYEIGHAYFTAMDKGRRIGNGTVEALFDMKIKPLLAEYLRAEYPQKELEGKLKEAASRFTLAGAADAEK